MLSHNSNTKSIIADNNKINFDMNTTSSTSSSIKDKDLYNIDIKVIIANAKADKIFHKLLNLCIKYEIQLFNQNNNDCTLYDIKMLILQCDIKQKKIIDELSNKITDISIKGPTNSWLLDIDKIYNEYKKKLKDIEIIIYILKNTYNDKVLINMCCSKINNTYKELKKNNNISSKYIAIYSN